jgi:3-hydroxyisobutyrate dehydrogenase-like beta-hydroxyacid dehydrogenase
MSKSVGIIGLGIMGGAIARNLCERGWSVTGFDVDPAACAALEKAGGKIAASVTELAKQETVLMTSLPSPKIVRAVAEEIAASSTTGRIVCELSTLALEDKLAFEAILFKAGHTPLDCPLSGTGAQAQTRDLVIYASGDSKAIECLEGLFLDFGKKVANLGAFGNGSRMKYVANYLVAINNVATAEAMVLGIQAGLDPQQIIEIVGPGAGGSKIFELRAPMMAANHYEPPTMRMATWRKDMTVIGDFARELGCPIPLFEKSNEIYEKGLEMDLGHLDTAAVCKVIESMGGFKR